MQQAFESLMPVMAVILLGVLLRRTLVRDPALWLGMEKVCFWLLFPSLLAKTLIEANLKGGQTGGLALTLVIAVLGFNLVALFLRPLLSRTLGTTAPAYSSVYQTATRWNGFIALAVVDKLFGESGLSLVAVALAAMVPLVNIQNVAVLRVILSSKPPGLLRLLQTLIKNPLILSCLIGLAINLLSLPIYAPVMATLDILGRAALGAGLILVGTGLRLRAALHPSMETWIASFLKLLVFPGFVAVLAFATGLEGEAFTIAIICAGVPTAMNGYILAKEKGGDAPLYAAITTIQTALSFITMPVLIALTL